MDLYPFNLVLAVATASATIFLGFLPTKTVPSTFFAREAVKAFGAWIIVAFSSPSAIVHYPGMLAFFCFASWWNFRRDHALAGKMWLSLASGLGISIGVMLTLAVTPKAYPPNLPALDQTLLLASIYLGGAVIGLAYVCFTLVQSVKTNTGATQSLVQRYVGVLPFLALARAAAILATFLTFSGYFDAKTIWHKVDSTTASPGAPGFVIDGRISLPALGALSLAVLVLPLLAFLAQRQAGFSSRVQPTRPLLALLFFGVLTEILARLLVL